MICMLGGTSLHQEWVAPPKPPDPCRREHGTLNIQKEVSSSKGVNDAMHVDGCQTHKMV